MLPERAYLGQLVVILFYAFFSHLYWIKIEILSSKVYKLLPIVGFLLILLIPG